MRNYIALIRKDADSDHGVSFPDFPGVVTAGTDLDDARSMAEEALALHVDGMVEDGEAIPEPSALEAVDGRSRKRRRGRYPRVAAAQAKKRFESTSLCRKTC
jgi:predicted RNase H-like HicB family nuclease